jgi:F-type H+-transporting ATPase subunit a
MLALIASLIANWQVGDIPAGGVVGALFNIVWKLFDMAIGVIQAFIFALLTVLYFGMAGAGHDEHEEHEAHSEDNSEEKKTAELVA